MRDSINKNASCFILGNCSKIEKETDKISIKVRAKI